MRGPHTRSRPPGSACWPRHPAGAAGSATRAGHRSRQLLPRGVRVVQAHRQNQCGGAGIMKGDEQFTFPPLPRDHYPPSGHTLPDLPPHHRLPARQGQRGPDRALPPGPSRSARPTFPVASPGDPRTVPAVVGHAQWLCPWAVRVVAILDATHMSRRANSRAAGTTCPNWVGSPQLSSPRMRAQSSSR